VPSGASHLAPDYFSAMPASFMTLPLEVRYQIYEYTCGEKRFVDLTCQKRENILEPARVDTARNTEASQGLLWFAVIPHNDPPLDLFAVLRTCRQVLQETISLLYAQAIFCFLLRDAGRVYNLRFFPEQSLPMIQNVDIVIERESLEAGLSYIEDRLAYLANGDTMRRLVLAFQFLSEADRFREPCDTSMKALGTQTGIPKKIAALKSLHHFQIIMNDYNPKMEEIIAQFVSQVETTIGEAHDSERWGLDGRFADGHCCHVWTWHLRRGLDKSS